MSDNSGDKLYRTGKKGQIVPPEEDDSGDESPEMQKAARRWFAETAARRKVSDVDLCRAEIIRVHDYLREVAPSRRWSFKNDTVTLRCPGASTNIKAIRLGDLTFYRIIHHVIHRVAIPGNREGRPRARTSMYIYSTDDEFYKIRETVRRWLEVA